MSSCSSGTSWAEPASVEDLEDLRRDPELAGAARAARGTLGDAEDAPLDEDSQARPDLQV